MTPSVYIVGGSSVGKSTLSAAVLDALKDRGYTHDPTQVELHKKPKTNGAIVTLRGELLYPSDESGAGVYLGNSRDKFPGTDGLDLVSSPVASEWAEVRGDDGYRFIFSEGAVLTTDRFLGSLARNTDLLLVHLVCDPMETELRMWERSSTGYGKFNPDYAVGTATKARNRVKKVRDLSTVLEIDTSSDSDTRFEDVVSRICRHLLS